MGQTAVSGFRLFPANLVLSGKRPNFITLSKLCERWKFCKNEIGLMLLEATLERNLQTKLESAHFQVQGTS